MKKTKIFVLHVTIINESGYQSIYYDRKTALSALKRILSSDITKSIEIEKR